MPQTLEPENLGFRAQPAIARLCTLSCVCKLLPELSPGTHKLERMQIFTFPLKTREIVIVDGSLVSCQHQLLRLHLSFLYSVCPWPFVHLRNKALLLQFQPGNLSNQDPKELLDGIPPCSP